MHERPAPNKVNSTQACRRERQHPDWAAGAVHRHAAERMHVRHLAPAAVGSSRARLASGSLQRMPLRSRPHFRVDDVSGRAEGLHHCEMIDADLGWKVRAARRRSNPPSGGSKLAPSRRCQAVSLLQTNAGRFWEDLVVLTCLCSCGSGAREGGGVMAGGGSRRHPPPACRRACSPCRPLSSRHRHPGSHRDSGSGSRALLRCSTKVVQRRAARMGLAVGLMKIWTLRKI